MVLMGSRDKHLDSVGCSPPPPGCDRWTVTHKPALGRKEWALPAGAEKESKENLRP